MTALSHRPELDDLSGLIAAAAPPVGYDERWWRATGDATGHARLAEVLADRPEQPLTDWRGALAGFLSHVADGTDAVADALLPDAGIPIGPAARAEMRATLRARLAEALQCVADRPTTGAAWRSLFDRRPALGFVVGVVCGQWRDALAELFERLDADLETLRARFWDGTRPGALTGYRGDAGDRHGQGRSVALLHFAAGVSVVYKPKELRHVAAVQELIADLSSELSLPLATRGVLLRGDYGWEEFVHARPVATAAGFGDFYRRLGMLARVMQLLGGRDLWADNLIADGDHPMFIDLECVMAAPPRPVPGGPGRSGGAGGTGAAVMLEESVVPTALVVQPWTSPQDVPVPDVSCLSLAGDARTVTGAPLLPLPPYRPFVEADGVRTHADPRAHGDDVVAGYREMHAVLVARHDTLLAGPLAGLRGAWVRCIRRNTWDCYKIIRASVTAAATADPSTREATLAALLRWPLTVGGQRRDLVDMALAEIDAFRVLDIPIFGGRTDSTSVFAADGTEIPGHFATTSWQLLTERVAALPDDDPERQVALLASCLDASAGAAAVRSLPEVRPGRVPSDDELVGTAAGIARGVLAARVDRGWIGQTWSPVTGLRHVEILGPDLASGTAGFAVLLAEVHAHTDDEVMRSAAFDVLDDAVRTSLALGADPGHQRIAGNARVPGGLFGPGAVVHALARCAERLDAPHLLDVATDLLPPALAAVHDGGVGARAVGDGAVAGRAGLLLNLLRLRTASLRLRGELPAGLDDTLVALVEQLAPRSARHTTLPRGGVPGEAAGVALALARAGAAIAYRGVVPDVRPPRVLDELTPLAELDTAGLLRCLHPGARDVRAAAGLLLARQRATGRWFPERHADDRVNLGALDGVGAVALGLLGVVDPGRTRPLTTLL